ncbi:hypothetical protein AVEN_56734-1 [Araneus ventricosus]|uniref:Uncharacterized protein n=1 Tax=Araneus ventricosus TaxID=182803 RepID=A0A4Y2W025_ARAVE|nr:hypothetical protein AVEN_56734-1 [Araneus ventricosus]
MNHSCTSGPKHLLNVIKNLRFLSDDLKKVVDPVISRNAFNATSRKPAAEHVGDTFENLPLAGLSREEDLLPQLGIVTSSSPNFTVKKIP